MPARTNTRRPRSASRARAAATQSRTTGPSKDYLPGKPAGHHYYVLDIPHRETIRAAQLGARYVERMDPAAKPNIQGWVFVGPSVPDELRPYLCAKYTRQHWYQQDINRTAVTTPPVATYDTGKFTLREDQRAKRDILAELWAKGGPEVLEASQTGTGKTVTTVATVKALPGVLNVLVVAPKGALPGWYQHIRDAGDGGKRWLRITPQSLIHCLSIPAKSRVKNSSRARELRIQHGVPLVRWDAIIVDESHLRANPTSQQSRILDKLISHSNAFVLNLSATPGESPAKLAYLHRGFSYATGATVRAQLRPAEYAAWCARHGMTVRESKGALTWEPNPEDAHTLHRLLFATEPRWAVTGAPAYWPEMERSGVPIELGPAERVAYNTVWAEFEREMQLLAARRLRAERGGNTREAARLRTAAREAQIRYRQKAGIIRAPYVADYVIDQVEAGYQVAVSCEFTNSTLAAIHDALVERGITPAHHTGNNVSTREQDRQSYQRGETPVILFSTTASINLHAGDTAVGGNTVPRLTVVSDMRWRGIDALQVEGRGQRNGQAAPARYIYAMDTIEERVIAVMLRKVQTLHTLTGQDSSLITDLAEEIGVALYDED